MDIHLAQLDPCPVRPQAVAATGRRRHAEGRPAAAQWRAERRSEEHTSELQSQSNLVCRLLLEKKKKKRRHEVFLMSMIFLSKVIKHQTIAKRVQHLLFRIIYCYCHTKRGSDTVSAQ